jgi:hypothetical protein
MKVLENTGYRMKVRSDSGDTLLIAQRHYTDQGVSQRGVSWYKGMVWIVFGWCAGKRFNLSGFNPQMKSKQELLSAIKAHPSYTIAAKELGLK